MVYVWHSCLTFFLLDTTTAIEQAQLRMELNLYILYRHLYHAARLVALPTVFNTSVSIMNACNIYNLICEFPTSMMSVY